MEMQKYADLQKYIDQHFCKSNISEEELLESASAKIRGIISNGAANYQEEEYQSIAGKIYDYMAEDEAQKYILMRYSLDFVDPFASDDVELQAFGNDEFSKLDAFIREHKNKLTFGDHIEKMREARGLSKVELYTKAGLTKQTYSKIIQSKNRNERNTIWNLVVGLECSLEEADFLFALQGMIRLESSMTDLIMQYYIERKIYDLIIINEALEHYNEKTLVHNRPVYNNDVF